MSRRRDNWIRTHEALLDAGAGCMAEVGFAGATVAQITKRAGVAHGTFFVHFQSKHALLDELFASRLAVVTTQAFEDVPEGPLVERLVSVADSLYRFYAANTELSRALLSHKLFLADQEQPRSADLFAGLLANLDRLVRGSLDSPSDKEPAAVVELFGALYYATLLAGLRSGAPSAAWTARLRAALTVWL
ncbi:MAG: TetR/AcrR family transcriptional regulator [Deltaproteobacteria bacterium]|nr:TetR/AcrR family transcriptional regulator [Deltaproteobacteria bacterium]MCB9788914.1 TetR/AcrR family transcriptional regulator [Deltaproteobacteria bacterium]